MSNELKALLKERNSGFRAGHETQYRAARPTLRIGIREACFEVGTPATTSSRCRHRK